MGIGWIIKTEYQDYTFQARTNQSFPSSTKAKLIAILSALITILRNTTVEIYTDSLAAINSINTYTNTYKTNQQNKLKNQITLDNINQIIQNSNIQMNLHKVKAHTEDTNNEIAD